MVVDQAAEGIQIVIAPEMPVHAASSANFGLLPPPLTTMQIVCELTGASLPA